jgi:hypothetical protein
MNRQQILDCATNGTIVFAVRCADYKIFSGRINPYKIFKSSSFCTFEYKNGRVHSELYITDSELFLDRKHAIVYAIQVLFDERKKLLNIFKQQDSYFNKLSKQLVNEVL